MSNTQRTDSPPSISTLLGGDELMTITKVAELLGIPRKTAANWVRSGILPGLRLGRERRVLRSKLQEFLEQKARMAMEEAERKQRDEERKRKLEQLQKHEKEQRWAEVLCVGCLATINTSRDQRLDGRVFCGDCESNSLFDRLSKEHIYRRVVIEIAERNQMAGERLSPREVLERHQKSPGWQTSERERTWKMIRCGECERPLAIRVADILNPLFFPFCDHNAPFGQGTPGESDDHAPAIIDSQTRAMLARLARLKATERNMSEDDFDPMDPWWDVYPCVVCGDETAVANPNIALIGGARCRSCWTKQVDHSKRVDSIIQQIRRSQLSMVVDGVHCLCTNAVQCPRGYVEIVEKSDGEHVLLSWCRSRTIDDKVELVRAYGERAGLTGKELLWLIDDVQYGDDLHLEHPLLGPSLWES